MHASSYVQHAKTLCAVLLIASAALQTAHAIESVTVIEYYNQSLDAYFITARKNEQASLDNTAGFSRTGTRFVANAAADATTSQMRICRFYVSSVTPFVSSHFYGAETIDCALRQANLPEGFSFEGYDFALTSTEATGACPVANKVPIYRAFRGVGTNASCASAAPFYYEIGDASGARLSGSMGLFCSATTQLPIASASKWIYGAYVTQARGSVLTADDIRFLNFTSGYISFSTCEQTDTVDSCAESGNHGNYTPTAAGKYAAGAG